MDGYTYFEDCQVGAVTETGEIEMTEAEIIKFAAEYDPQPMHVDPEAAKSITGGLIASGWHTASTTMKLMVTRGNYRPAPGTVGLGFDSLRWNQPVRPGDRLRLRVEVLQTRASQSKPGWGIVTNKFTTLNQRGEPVQEMQSSAIFPMRNK
jgi:acyl dehydratase